jgi:hypothetical protein
MPPASLASSREKLSTDPRIGQPACCGLCQELWDLSTSHKRLPRTRTARRKRMSGVRGLVWEAYMSCWSGFPLQGVHQFKSPQLSDISNRLFVVVST